MNNHKLLISSTPITVLSVTLVMIVTLGISATGWTKGVSIVTFAGVGATIISLMLIRSILSWWVAHLTSTIIGLGWCFWVTSRLLPATYSWMERWEVLMGRLQYWYWQAINGGTSYDNLMFVFQMNLIIWLMVYLTLWLILRSGRVWQAIIPGGLVLLINLYYAPQDITWWFIAYILVSLLLVIRFNLFRQELRWRAEGTFFRSDISFDFLRDGFILSMLVLGVAWFTPPLVDAKTLDVFDEFQGSWQDIQRNWNRLYADLDYRDPSALETFGTSLTLGGPRNLTDDPVMDVKVEGLGRYWRAITYDQYDGGGWRSNDGDADSFGPDSTLAVPYYEARQLITQTYIYHRQGSTVLYAMSNPVALNRSARATFNALPADLTQRSSAPFWSEGDTFAEEVTYMRSDAVVNQGESYQVVSLSSQATIQQLGRAGTNYPNWVTDRYLQLPSSITPRTRELAQEVTASADNNFDKAVAVERYLRNEISYNEKIAQPPTDVDKVDYILFTSKEGYCDYYASSMIVMLRSIGVPARFAVGFARGKFDSEKGAYHVINADAHSWVEVYFPQYGWIEFEPTSAQPVIIRMDAPEDEDGTASGSNTSLEERPERELPDPPENIPIDDEAVLPNGGPFIAFGLPWGGQLQISQTVIMGMVGFIMVAILLLGGGGIFLWQRQQTGNYKAQSIFRIYQQLLRFSDWVGLPIQPEQTPFEHTHSLQTQFPTRQAELSTITEEYVQQTFGTQRTNSTVSAGSVSSYESATAWGTLQPELLKAAVKNYLAKLRGMLPGG
ncbi:DUF3488 and transglutaminase-like domain-containing protein [Anaerolineales bacterium HSG6]|nr:DUF3488 and transglutaminase-like domain-containing protein [Anaerolineales bacterium HSG6]